LLAVAVVLLVAAGVLPAAAPGFVVFAAVFRTTGFFFAVTAAVVVAGVVAGVVAVVPPVSIATSLLPGQSRQIKNTANRTKVLLSGISTRSNLLLAHPWSSQPRPTLRL